MENIKFEGVEIIIGEEVALIEDEIYDMLQRGLTKLTEAAADTVRETIKFGHTNIGFPPVDASGELYSSINPKDGTPPEIVFNKGFGVLFSTIGTENPYAPQLEFGRKGSGAVEKEKELKEKAAKVGKGFVAGRMHGVGLDEGKPTTSDILLWMEDKGVKPTTGRTSKKTGAISIKDSARAIAAKIRRDGYLPRHLFSTVVPEIAQYSAFFFSDEDEDIPF